MEKPFSIRKLATLEVVREADTLTEALRVLSEIEIEDNPFGAYDNVLEEIIF